MAINTDLGITPKLVFIFLISHDFGHEFFQSNIIDISFLVNKHTALISSLNANYRIELPASDDGQIILI